MPLRPEEQSQTFRQCILIAVGLVAMTWIVFWPVHQFELLNYDDVFYVTENYHVKNGLTVENVKWAFTTDYLANWQPMMWLSLMLDAQIYGDHAGGFHLTNLLIHTCNVLLLFELLRRTTGGVGRSAFVAALFAIHPLHIESVAWVSERKDVVFTLFGLLSMLAYCRYIQGGTWRWYLAALVAFILSLATKPMLVTLPFLLLLFDYWPLKRTKWNLPEPSGAPGSGECGARRLLIEKIPFFAVALVFCLIALLTQGSGGAIASVTKVSLSVRILNAVLVYGLYLAHTFWPAGLTVIYPHPGESISLSAVAVSSLILSLITAAVFVQIKKRPYLFVGWCWYLGTLVPVIGLVQIGSQQMADRYTYVPLIGFFIAVAWFVPSLFPQSSRRPILLRAIASVLIVAGMIVSRIHLQTWRNSVTVFTHAISVTENNVIAHYQLGIALHKENRNREAIVALRKSLRLAPDFADAHSDLGVALYSIGNVKEAAFHFEKAVTLELDHVKALVNLGVALYRLKRNDEGFAHLKKAVRLDPENVNAHINLGNALELQQNSDEARGHFQRAAELDPGNWLPHYKLATLLHAKGDLETAEREYEAAITLNPDFSEAHYRMAMLYIKRRQRRSAIEHLQEAMKLNPRHNQARQQLRRLTGR